MFESHESHKDEHRLSGLDTIVIVTCQRARTCKLAEQLEPLRVCWMRMLVRARRLVGAKPGVDEKKPLVAKRRVHDAAGLLTKRICRTWRWHM